MFFSKLDEPTLNSLIDFFQKQQMDAMKESNTICDAKELKKIQRKIALFNTLAMTLMKLKNEIK